MNDKQVFFKVSTSLNEYVNDLDAVVTLINLTSQIELISALFMCGATPHLQRITLV